MTAKKKVGYALDPQIVEELRALAHSDRRSIAGEIEWLVACEVARRQVIPDMKRRTRDALVKALSS